MFQSLFFLPPSHLSLPAGPGRHIQDDAGQLLGAQGPGDLPERGGGVLGRLGRVRVHRLAGEAPGPLPLQLLPH